MQKTFIIGAILRHCVKMRFVRFAAILLFAVNAAGCFQMTTVVTVNGDGSGTIDHTLLVTKAALAQLRNFSALGGGRAQSLDLTSEDQARAMADTLGPGVAYLSSEPVDTPLGEGRHAVYAFRDISQVRISQQPSADGLPVRMNARSGDITCSLTHEPNGHAVLHINLPDVSVPANFASGANGNPGLAQQLALIRSLLAGARVSIGVEPDGQIVKSSSPFVEGGRVTLLDANLDQILSNETLLTRLQESKTPEDVKAALVDVPGLKLTLDREVTIEFTPAK
jgi:hypothetical protein